MVVASVSTIILASVVLFAIIATIAIRANEGRINKRGKTLPGPPQWPLLGNTFPFTKKTEDLLDVFLSLFESYPSIYQMRVGPLIIIGINDPDLAKTVLVDQKLIERVLVEKLLKQSLGTGLLTARPVTWRLHRKIIAPSFNWTFLRNSIDVLNSQAKIMVEQWKVHQDGPEFETEHYISTCIFDMINETTMNVKLGTQTTQDQVFKMAADSINNIAAVRLFTPWLHPEFFFNLSSLGVKCAECVEAARGFARRVIHEQMKEINNHRPRPDIVDHEEHAETPSIQKKTLLHLLMEWNSGEVKLSDEEIIDELITIAITATDTTATATNMLMLALACYPDVQKKVFEEVTEVCGNGEGDGKTITMDQLNHLVYVERVVKETLRLFPVASIIPRDVMEDMTIGDYHVPKGAVIAIMVSALHKNEKSWPDPLKFDPDRFSPEEAQKRHPYAYMPFGAGPRNCIGWKYAMMSMKMICAKVVQKYALEKDHPENIADTKMKFGLSLKPCEPVTIRIRKRRENIAKA